MNAKTKFPFAVTNIGPLLYLIWTLFSKYVFVNNSSESVTRILHPYDTPFENAV